MSARKLRLVIIPYKGKPVWETHIATDLIRLLFNYELITQFYPQAYLINLIRKCGIKRMSCKFMQKNSYNDYFLYTGQ